MSHTLFPSDVGPKPGALPANPTAAPLAFGLAGVFFRSGTARELDRHHPARHRRIQTTLGVTKLARDVHSSYRKAPPDLRREFNQFWFRRLDLFDEEGVSDGPGDVAELILDEELPDRLPKDPEVFAREADETDWDGFLEEVRGVTVASATHGSKVACVVEVTGFEPVAPTLRT